MNEMLLEAAWAVSGEFILLCQQDCGCFPKPARGLNGLRLGDQGQEGEKLFQKGECRPNNVTEEEKWMKTRAILHCHGAGG